MTLGELSLDMIQEWGEKGDDEDRLSLVDKWIIDALAEFSTLSGYRACQFRFTVPTTASIPYVTLDPSVVDIRAIRISGSNAPMSEMPDGAYGNRYISSSSTGKPREYFVLQRATVVDGPSGDIGMQLAVYPTPDAVYTLLIDAYVHPIDLSSNDVIPLNGIYLSTLKHKVRALQAFDDGDVEAADRHDAAFMRGLQLFQQRENQRPAANLRRGQRAMGRNESRFVRLDPEHYRNR